MDEITFEDYMQNSGTRGSEPLEVYKTNRASIKTSVFKQRPDGLYERFEKRYYKHITIPL